jgi:diguanylate cyclase (GGDEF)-like protein
VASAAAESVLQAIDLAVDGLDAPARSVGPLFTPPRTELEERVQKLAAYIGWILQVSELASRPSEEIVTRNLQLRRRLSEALSGSTDFEVPGVEAAVVYIFGTFLAGTPPPTFAALPRLTNQIPLQFDLLVQCSEATLNLLRVEQDRAGPTARRRKSEKFGILDSPTLLSSDLAAAKGPLGTACIYLDIDDFKALNTRFTERVVDRDLLPDFQRLLSSMVDAVGFAYAEGGDEYAALLPNSTSKMANAFVEGLQEQLRRRVFEVSGERIELQISVGIAHVEAGGDRDALPELANAAMRAAKAAGKNRTYLHTVEGPQDVGGQPGP